jgi:hypothetical protein
MVWFLVDDVLPFHERVLRAGNAAMGLWVRGGAWCSGQLTDGFIPAEVARTMGTPAEVRKLVAVGLWSPETRDGQEGYLFHAWAEDGTGQKRQPTKAEVEEKRRKERERKAAYRSRADTAPLPTSVPQGVPAGVPVGQAAGRPVGVPQVSQQASAYPVQSSPNQATDSHVSQSSLVPERVSSTDDEDESNRVREHYWRGLGITNPDRLKALLVQYIDRPLTDRQTLSIVTGILAKAKQRPRSPQAYVEGAIPKSWAEIQQQLDEAQVAA